MKLSDRKKLALAKWKDAAKALNTAKRNYLSAVAAFEKITAKLDKINQQLVEDTRK